MTAVASLGRLSFSLIRCEMGDPSAAATLHAEKRGADGVEGRRKVHRENVVSAVDRELFGGCDALRAGVIDQNIY
jgi:hypothetical protein